MLILNYDSRTTNEINDLLYYYKLIGQQVIKINVSNLRGKDLTLTDVLYNNPGIVAIGLGTGIANDVMERRELKSRLHRFHHCDQIRHLLIKFSPFGSPTTPIPVTVEDLVIEIAINKIEASALSEYLEKIIIGDTSPALHIINLDSIIDWSGFSLPGSVRKLVSPKRRNFHPEFLRIIGELGFRRTERSEDETVFEKKDE